MRPVLQSIRICRHANPGRLPACTLSSMSCFRWDVVQQGACALKLDSHPMLTRTRLQASPIPVSTQRGYLSSCAPVLDSGSGRHECLQLLQTIHGNRQSRPIKLYRPQPPNTARLVVGFHQVRHIFGGDSGGPDPYKVLGVSRNATDKEIKMAYFKIARKLHPDTNPDDPDAKRKFQEAADAYSLLSDKGRRASWDTFGTDSKSGAGGGYGNTSHTREDPMYAEKIFEDLLKDIDVAQTVVHDYFRDLRDDINFVAEDVSHGNYQELWEFVKRRKGLFATVFLPLLVVFRMPAVALAGTAFVARIGGLMFRIFASLPQRQQMSLIGAFIATIKQFARSTRQSDHHDPSTSNEDSKNDGSSRQQYTNNRGQSGSHPPPPGQSGTDSSGRRGSDNYGARTTRSGAKRTKTAKSTSKR